ncbi:FKBP-type peptidyl-prolyl cis-trans isomerase [Algibacter aquimarinus]|uniref:Peptidyl-prolyl cis-trans isomerase n=1 Tax=Algibacter aquimarinus TaxID=1136748 RepID=A0ABP9H7I9_9FLAO
MKTIKFLSVVALTISLVSCNKNGVSNKPLQTEIDSVSYSLGLNIAGSVKANASEIDKDIFIQGFVNGIDSTDLKIEQDKVQGILNAYFQKKQVEAQEKQRLEAEKKAEEEYGDVKAAGEKFLNENMTKEGVEITDSGLQYIVLKEGTGEKPNPTSKIKIHYHGTLIDGTVFDSTVEKGKPYQALASQFIPGFTEGLLLMPEGSKYKFFIPQDIGYGAFPRQGGVIKPFAPLIFEVELLEIIK